MEWDTSNVRHGYVDEMRTTGGGDERELELGIKKCRGARLNSLSGALSDTRRGRRTDYRY